MENQIKKYEEELEIDLVDYFRVIWRYKKPILAIFVLAMIVAIILSFLAPKTYQSSALVSLAKKISGQFLEGLFSTKISGQFLEDPTTIINILKQESSLKKLAQKLGLPEREAPALAKRFKISSSGGLLEIKGFGPTPEKAQEIVEVVTNFIIDRQNNLINRFKSDLENEINLLKDELEKNAADISDLEAKIASSVKTTSQAQGFITGSYISALEMAKLRRDELNRELYKKERELNFMIQEAKIETPAILSDQPISPNKKRNVIIGAVLGLFVGILYAFLAEYWQKNKSRFVV